MLGDVARRRARHRRHDELDHRSYVFTSLGDTDELVSVKGTEVESIQIGESRNTGYFDEAAFVPSATQWRTLPSWTASRAIFETVAVQDRTSRQNRPRITLFASDPAALEAFGPISSDGGTVSLRKLRPGEVFVTGAAADDLAAKTGDRLLVLAGERAMPLRIRAIVEYDGAGTDSPRCVVPLDTAQRLLGQPGRVEHILVSNTGDAERGVTRSDEVIRLLEPTLTPLGLEADPEKKTSWRSQTRRAASSLFTTFGSFSIVAGILLIFLIFVMLAAERRGSWELREQLAHAEATSCRHTSSKASRTTWWRPWSASCWGSPLPTAWCSMPCSRRSTWSCGST